MANRIMNFNILKNNSGFGLIEIIVALLVLSIALIPVIQMSSSHHKDTVDAGIKATALNLAQRKLEEFKSTKKVDDVVNKNFDDPFSKYTYTVTKVDNNKTYEVTITVKYYDYSQDPPTLKEVAKLVGEVEK